MSTKMRLFSVISILLALAVIVGTFSTATAAYITTTNYEIGRQGIYIPGGFDPNNVKLTTINAGNAGYAPVKFSRSVLRLRYISSTGNTIDTPFIMTYVYFTLKPWERKAYDNGTAGIYYLDLSTNSWKQCPSFIITGKNLPNGRIACLATQYTLFGFGYNR
jgi:hypothetical protein